MLYAERLIAPGMGDDPPGAIKAVFIIHRKYRGCMRSLQSVPLDGLRTAFLKHGSRHDV
jgi:hypothetical protein